MQAQTSSSVVVAKIVKAHGIAGEVVLQSFTDVIGRLETTKEFQVWRNEDFVRKVRVETRRFFNGRHVMKFEGINTRTEAEALRGTDLAIPEEELGSLPADQFFIHELIGMTVRLITGTVVGLVKNVMKTGGVDLLEVGEKGELLIPFTEEICIQVDAARREITIDPPEGLLQLNAR
jgi:16S rRNA processing protein RimM